MKLKMLKLIAIPNISKMVKICYIGFRKKNVIRFLSIA